MRARSTVGAVAPGVWVASPEPGAWPDQWATVFKKENKMKYTERMLATDISNLLVMVGISLNFPLNNRNPAL